MRFALLMVLVAAACGGGPRPAGTEGPGPRIDAGVPGTVTDTGTGTGTVTVTDAGTATVTEPATITEPDDPTPDAGLAELGAYECELVIERVLNCPGVPEDTRRALADELSRIRDEAARLPPERRAEIAAGCREMARELERSLLEMGC